MDSESKLDIKDITQDLGRLCNLNLKGNISEMGEINDMHIYLFKMLKLILSNRFCCRVYLRKCIGWDVFLEF